jgi:hypothetical protein
MSQPRSSDPGRPSPVPVLTPEDLRPGIPGFGGDTRRPQSLQRALVFERPVAKMDVVRSQRSVVGGYGLLKFGV